MVRGGYAGFIWFDFMFEYRRDTGEMPELATDGQESRP
jgi:hypothetical protein